MFPRLLRLRREALARRDAVLVLVARALRPRPSELPRAVHAFAFKNDEHAFARALLEARTQLWLFRSNQRAFCGDFVVVDMSASSPDRRRAWIVDLKRGADLRFGGGGAGVQLTNAPAAHAELTALHALAATTPLTPVTGDGRALIAFFGAVR